INSEIYEQNIRQINNINAYFIVIFCAYIFGSVISYVRGIILAKIGNTMYKKLLSDFVNKAIELPLRYYNSRKIGDILNRYDLIKQINEVLSSIIVIIGMDLSIIIGSILLLFVINKVLFFL